MPAWAKPLHGDDYLQRPGLGRTAEDVIGLADSQSDADLYAQAATQVMDVYRNRIEGRTQAGESAARIRRSDDIERTIRLAGLRAERDTVFSLARSQSLSDASARKLVRELDLLEARLT